MCPPRDAFAMRFRTPPPARALDQRPGTRLDRHSGPVCDLVDFDVKFRPSSLGLYMVTALILIGIFAVVIFSAWIVSRSGRSFLVRAITTLPASSFPERADVYVCDKCARDVTKRFRPRGSHSWTPVGSPSFVCRCGQRYLTGAIEWDYLGLRERHRRVWQTLVLGVFLSGMFSIFGILVYLALRFLFHLRDAGFLVAVFITALPFVWLQMTFWPEVLASMWRTRIGSSFEHT